MDDKTIQISNCSHKFDDNTTDIAILTDDTSVESEAPPILTKTMPLTPRHIIWKQTIQQQNLDQSPQTETLFNT